MLDHGAGRNKGAARSAPATEATTRLHGDRPFGGARRPITIRDLLTHTAGVSYGTEEAVAALYEPKGLGPAAGYGRPRRDVGLTTSLSAPHSD